MKRLCLVLLVSCLAVPGALAQEHYTEGPVWACSALRTKQGHFDDYMKYLRQNFVPQGQESKKAGLIVDQKIYVKVPENPTDPDVLICTLHASFGKALDYNAEDEKKSDAIEAAHWKTANNDEQRAKAASRLELREFLGVDYSREVNLKPIK